MAKKSKKKPTQNQIDEAIDLFFDKHLSRNEVAKQTGVSIYYITKELDDNRICYHPLCTKGHPCRAARRGTNKHLCSALTNTDFGMNYCPFFKLEDDFNFEYRLTNKMTDFELKSLGYK